MTLDAVQRGRISALPTLEQLARRRALSARQVAAGRRLARTYAFGIVGQRDTGGGGLSAGGFCEARLSAAQDYSRSRDLLGGRLWPVTWAVVCGDQSVQEVAAERGQNPTATMTLLKLALDLLADRFGLPE